MVFFDGEFVPRNIFGTFAAVALLETNKSDLGFSSTSGIVLPFNMRFEAVEVATSLLGEVAEGLATMTPGIVVG